MTTPKQGLTDTAKSGKRGRPLALTPQIATKICLHIAEGNYREIAAKAVGVSPRTMTHWCKLGREGKEPYAEFLLAVMQAETTAEIEAVKKVLLAGADDPKHCQWFLERKFPERWGRDRLEVKDLKKALADLESKIEAMLRVQCPPTTGATDTSSGATA